MSKLKVLDLFSGIGGFSLGLERTGGFETVAFCEIDEKARKVLKKHWPTITQFEDVSKLTQVGNHLLDGTREVYVKPDVICGGFPCQDISVAGKGKGLDGKRSGLWTEYKRLIEEIKPRYAIIENVANLRGKGLSTVLKDLWEIGYDAEWHIISARSVGAVHLRERIWIVAYPNSEGSQRRLCESGEGRTLGQEQNCTNINHGMSDQTQLNSTNTDHLRLWKPFASEEEKQEWWTETAASVSHWREVESVVRGVDDGLSRGVDRYRKERIKQLGNSVVPQIVQIIGQGILEYENKKESYAVKSN